VYDALNKDHLLALYGKCGGLLWSDKMGTVYLTFIYSSRQLLTLFFTCWLLTFSTLTLANETKSNETEGEVKGVADFSIPSWFKQSFLEISVDATEAGESGKHLLLFFHLDNCPYCARMLKDNFNAEPNSSFIQSNFDSIEINIKGDREVALNEDIRLTEKVLAQHLKVLHTPTILFADSNNRSVLRIDGYRNPTRFQIALDYVHEKAYLKKSFSDFSTSRLKPANYSFRSHPAFSVIQDFEKAASKPLAMIFEDASCEDCNEIHDSLFARDDVSKAFSELTVVRIDAMSSESIVDVSGNKTTPRAWVKNLNLTYRPGVILFDRGREIARIDNRLYSWHFNGFVKWVAGRHYEQYPNVFSYMAKLREEQLALGKDVSYVD
jgi:thioredoxin-related protein